MKNRIELKTNNYLLFYIICKKHLPYKEKKLMLYTTKYVIQW